MPEVPPEPPEPVSGSAEPEGIPIGSSGEAPAVPGEQLEYRESTSEAFAAGASRFMVLPTRDGVVLSGPCPRCGHAMEFPHVGDVYMGTPAFVPDAAVNVLCTCEVLHPGCPEGLGGCGAYWNVRLERVQP